MVHELQAELEHGTERVERLRMEYEKYSRLAEIEEDKARALLKELHATLSKGRGMERMIGFCINLFAGLIVFVLGVLLSPWLRSLLGLS